MLWVIFAANAAMSPEPVECMPEKPAGDPGTELRDKKWGIVALRMAIRLSLLCVLRHNVTQVASQRHQSGFEEFRVSNNDYCLLQVDIREIEKKSFADS